MSIKCFYLAFISELRVFTLATQMKSLSINHGHSQALKVLFVIPSLTKGGAERLALDLSCELQRRDIEVKVITLHPENKYTFLSSSLEVTQCSSYLKYHLLRKNEFDFENYISIVNSFQPHVIHSHLFEAEFFSRALLFSGVTYFSHLHDNMIQFENFNWMTLSGKTKLTSWLEKERLIRSYKKCNNYFIANSDDTANYFKKRLTASLRKNLEVIENGTDLTRFPFVSRSFPYDTIRLISVGSLVTKKNHSFLIDVVKQIKESGQNVHLQILGDGPLMNELKEKTRRLNLNENIEMCGTVDDVTQRLHQAHIYVHAATYEPFGLSIVEAMATGLPVVCLDAAGNRVLIADHLNGFILTEVNPEIFALMILTIIKDESAFRQFSRNARKKAEEFDIKITAEKTITFYLRALQNSTVQR